MELVKQKQTKTKANQKTNKQTNKTKTKTKKQNQKYVIPLHILKQFDI